MRYEESPVLTPQAGAFVCGSQALADGTIWGSSSRLLVEFLLELYELYAHTIVWDKAMQLLQAWMTSVHTDPDIRQAILARLQRWRNGTNNDIPMEGSMQYALAQQTDIGWGNLLEGWISSKWALEQQT